MTIKVIDGKVWTLQFWANHSKNMFGSRGTYRLVAKKSQNISQYRKTRQAKKKQVLNNFTIKILSKIADTPKGGVFNATIS